MSRCDSDMDYTDEPWHKPTPCATRRCDGTCDAADSAFCYECRNAELIAQANEPLAVECVWCTPPHLISPGRLPASSTLCAKALAAEHAKLDHIDASRQQGAA